MQWNLFKIFWDTIKQTLDSWGEESLLLLGFLAGGCVCSSVSNQSLLQGFFFILKSCCREIIVHSVQWFFLANRLVEKINQLVECMQAECCILLAVSGLLLKLKAEKISTCFLESVEETTPPKCQVSSFFSYNAEVRSLGFMKSYSALKFPSITIFAFRDQNSL